MEGDEKEDKKQELHPETKRFVDKMLAIYTDYQMEAVARSFFFLDTKIRKHRLQSIMDLSVERDRLLEEHGHRYGPNNERRGLFASAYLEVGIEYLIQGDVDEVRAYADMYLFNGEGDDLKAEWVPIYAKFRAMLLAAIEDPEAMQ